MFKKKNSKQIFLFLNLNRKKMFRKKPESSKFKYNYAKKGKKFKIHNCNRYNMIYISISLSNYSN